MASGHAPSWASALLEIASPWNKHVAAALLIASLGLASCDKASGIEGRWSGPGFSGIGFTRIATTFRFTITSHSIATNAQFLGNMGGSGQPIEVTYKSGTNGWIVVVLRDGMETDAAFKVVDSTHIVFQGSVVAGRIELQKDGA